MKILQRLGCVVLLIGCTVGVSFGFYGGTNESGEMATVDNCVVPKYDYFHQYTDKVNVSFGQITDKPFASGEEAGNNCVNSLWEDILNANFEIKYSGTSSNISTLVNVSMISDDLPDITPCSETMFGELYEQEMLCDLTDYYEYYASPALKQVLEYNTIADLSSATEEEKLNLAGCNLLASCKKVEGEEERLYAIPMLLDKYTYCPYVWIRSDWLAEMGESMPTTRSEILALAEKFKSRSDCTYPIYTNDINFLYEWFGGIPSFYEQDDATGDWSYSSIGSSFQNALESVRQLGQSGMIDTRIFSEASNALAEVKQGNVGIYIGYFWQPQGGDISIVAQSKDVDWQVMPLCDDNGDVVEVYSRPNIKNYYVVSSKCEHPEILFLMLNHMVEEWVNPTSTDSVYTERLLELMETPKYESLANYMGEWGPVIFDVPDKNYYMSWDIRDTIAENGTDNDLKFSFSKYNYNLIKEYITQGQTPASNNYNWIYYKIFYESTSMADKFFDKMNYGGYFGTATTGMLNYSVSISNVESTYISNMVLQSTPITDKQFAEFRNKMLQAGVDSVLEELERDYKYKWWKGEETA